MIAAVLTPAQAETVQHYAVLTPASWFVGKAQPDGTVEVIALGPDFVWALSISPDGEVATSEATLGEFSTGIEV